MLYLVYAVILLFSILIYFRLAQRFNIVDEPNHRSSHKYQTVRGSGIIFPLGILLIVLFQGVEYPIFSFGLLLISLVSFYDDKRPLSSGFRLISHLAAVSLLFLETGVFDQKVWIIVIAYVLVIGTINAYNFMDGINGIMAAYSLVTMVTLYFINEYIVQFILSDWIIICCISLLIFAFFNFRVRSKCFAGDVGSISIAFVILFFILTLIIKTGEVKYGGLLLIYGLDTVTTVIFRVIRGENLLLAHRSHFYQYLVNIRAWPHLAVSSLYAIVQLGINLLIVHYSCSLSYAIGLTICTGLLMICLRFLVEGKDYLMQGKISSN